MNGPNRYSCRVDKICDLPVFEQNENLKYTRELYCFVLRFWQAQNLTKLYVTDFTSHPKLEQRDFDTEDSVIPGNQIMEIAVTPRWYSNMKSDYRRLTGLAQHEFSKIAYHDILLVKARVRLKMYSNKLECLTDSIVVPILEKEPEAYQPYIRSLLSNLFILQRSAMSSNLYLPRLVPQSYWPGDFESDFSSEDLKYPVSRSSFTSSQYQQHQQQQQPQHQQPSSTGSSQHHMPQFVSDSMPVSRPDHKGFLFSNDANEPNSQPNIPHSSQPAPKDPPNSHGSSQNNVSQPRNSHQTDGNSNSNSGDSLFGYSLGDSHSQVKIERSPYTLSKIPDREFPGDYEDDSDSDQVSNRTPIRRGSSVLQVPATASLSSGSKVLSTLVDSSLSQEVYTLAELNQFPMNIDKKVYNVNAYIVGILPEDLSYVVSKTYEFDHSLEKYIPGDPTARSLEFILTDEVPPSLSSQNNLCLTQDNSLKIMIPARHIVEFFNSQSIEEIYMALPEFNKYFYENLELISKTLFKFQLFKTKVAIKPEEREVVWTARNFSVRELLSNSGLPDM